VIQRLGEWGQRWTVRVSPQNLDAGFLMWDVQRRIAINRLPTRRVTARFDFRRLPAHYRGASTFWLVLERPEVDLCLTDPGFEVDVVVTADLGTFAKVWLGDIKWRQALSSRAVRLEGAPEWVRAFPTWLLLGGFAGVDRPRRLRAS
jgi:hypothetical protein